MSPVRQAKANDGGAIQALSAHLDYKALAGATLDRNLEKILASDSDRLWVFERANEVLGWIHVFTATRVASEPFVEIGGMVVSPSQRRQGIGRQLVTIAEHWASEHKLKLRVGCNTSREEAHRFYESVGFVLAKSQNVFEMHF